MRIPVVDTRGVALMPCTPAKARDLLKHGQARPKRNKLGLFYVQLCYEQEPENQPLVVGIDPGSKFEGFSVVGRIDTVTNLMVEAPDHVKGAVETRRTMRRARRFRKWRRPKRFDNRLTRRKRLPPSTRSRWEARARIVSHLLTILPLSDAVVEDVQAHFDSHAVDGWVLAASVSGAPKPTCTRLWYLVPAILHRRQLHRLQASKGGERKPYGGTRSLGLKRGTLVRHPTYGRCTVGGFDRKRHAISLHAYRTNKRLTQGAKVKDCQVLSWVAFRSWLVEDQATVVKGQGEPIHPCPIQGTPASSPCLKDEGSPQAEVR
ncbi:MAG: hypothetical protein E6I91_06020 [Chloroflexi bacterium]|nr:MAG: hypothetical protein E6I91_06020 [Chloroflexota bacterium]